eukprot:2670328-Pleurochrysis_carterae.AAC.1
MDGWLWLQTVKGTGIETYEDTPVMRDLVDGNRMHFTHCHRLVPGQESFLAVCKAARAGEPVPVELFPVKNRYTLTNLCYTNRK